MAMPSFNKHRVINSQEIDVRISTWASKNQRSRQTEFCATRVFKANGRRQSVHISIASGLNARSLTYLPDFAREGLFYLSLPRVCDMKLHSISEIHGSC